MVISCHYFVSPIPMSSALTNRGNMQTTIRGGGSPHTPPPDNRPPPTATQLNGIVNHNNEYAILQCDGNATVSSVSSSTCECCEELSDNTGCSLNLFESYSSSYDDPPMKIPVIIRNRCNLIQRTPPPWYEEYTPRIVNMKQSKQNLRTIRRDNRVTECETLPIISVSNVRSLMPKINSFKNDMRDRDISLALLSEVWEKANCKKQQSEVEKMLNLDGLKYVSTPGRKKKGVVEPQSS